MVVAGSESSDRGRRTPEELETQVGYLEAEVGDLRRRLSDSPVHSRALEQRLAETQRSLAGVTAQNERLAQTLREARDQIMTLKEEVDRLAQPPAGFGTFLNRNDDDSIDVFTGGRKLRVNVSPSVDLDDLRRGQEVMLNEALNVVAALKFEQLGEVVMLKEVLADGERVLVIANADEERVVRLADPLLTQQLRAGDSLLLDTRSGYAYERVPKSEVEELVLEEVPDIDYASIGGLKGQIDQIQDAVELPYLYPELFKEHELKPPKGVLLYGPPGCGKTLIAKAVANSLAKKVAARTGQEGKSYFLNIKGPELLNKYVGETERHIRLVFQRAREKASQGTPVIVFFDEMDSLFRTRGSGVSSDVENTIVPQLLSEIDGVETLENVLVIGASNREDMIDPAILRPGRLDVKIKIERPDAESARDIFSKYLTKTLPLHAEDLAEFGGDREACVNDVHRERGEPLPRGDLRQRRQGDPVLQGLQLRRDDPEHRRPGQEDGDQGPPGHRPEGHPGHPPPAGLRRRVQGERRPAQHHQPRRLGADLRQEG
jgi:proteasome-associated ATPase